MWPFSSEPSKASLQGHRTVVIHGHRFVIRKVNPLLDFRDDNMPQIFAAHVSRRKVEPQQRSGTAESRARADMAAMIEAGLVEPKLVPEGVGDKKGQEDGLTVRDVLRDEETAGKLYWEILVHSLNRFRGIKGVFFSARLRHSLSMSLRSGTGSDPATSPSVEGNLA